MSSRPKLVSASSAQAQAQSGKFRPIPSNFIPGERPDNPFWVQDEGNWHSEKGGFNPRAYDPGAYHVIKGRVLALPESGRIVAEDPSDPKNLRFVTKVQLDDFLGQLEQLARRPKIERVLAMIATGGTIAMYLRGQELIPGLNTSYLVEHAGGHISENFGVTGMEFPRLLDSSEVEIDYLADLVLVQYCIWQLASPVLRSKLCGVVITHGTDTMENSSANMAMMLGPDCPFSVAMICAQKTPAEFLSDAGVNVLYGMQCVAEFSRAGLPNTFVYAGGTEGGAYAAAGVIKISDRRIAAFDSPAHPSLVSASDAGFRGIQSSFLREYKRREALWRPIPLRGYFPVKVIAPKQGDDPWELIKELWNSSAPYVVIQALGGFTINPKQLHAIMEVTKHKKQLVFAANPFPGGSTDYQYGPANLLRDSGVHIVHMLPPALKAKLLLAHRLFAGDLELVVAFITKNNFVGEQPPDIWKPSVYDGASLGPPKIWYELQQGDGVKS